MAIDLFSPSPNIIGDAEKEDCKGFRLVQTRSEACPPPSVAGNHCLCPPPISPVSPHFGKWKPVGCGNFLPLVGLLHRHAAPVPIRKPRPPHRHQALRHSGIGGVYRSLDAADSSGTNARAAEESPMRKSVTPERRVRADDRRRGRAYGGGIGGVPVRARTPGSPCGADPCSAVSRGGGLTGTAGFLS